MLLAKFLDANLRGLNAFLLTPSLTLAANRVKVFGNQIIPDVAAAY